MTQIQYRMPASKGKRSKVASSKFAFLVCAYFLHRKSENGFRTFAKRYKRNDMPEYLWQTRRKEHYNRMRSRRFIIKILVKMANTSNSVSIFVRTNLQSCRSLSESTIPSKTVYNASIRFTSSSICSINRIKKYLTLNQ